MQMQMQMQAEMQEHKTKVGVGVGVGMGITRIMREGCLPLSLATAAIARSSNGNSTSTSNSTASAAAAAAAAAAGKIALVHGYCAGGAAFSTASFTSFSTFADYGQTRRVDDFAQRVGDHLASTGSFSIASHSQGGMASLHLLTCHPIF
jgi:hypothetical protein